MYLLAICTSAIDNALFSHLPLPYGDVDVLGVEFFEFPIDSGYLTLIR
jgi:hypothetical protein